VARNNTQHKTQGGVKSASLATFYRAKSFSPPVDYTWYTDQPRPGTRLLIVVLVVLFLLVVLAALLAEEVGSGFRALLNHLVLGLAELAHLVGRTRHALEVASDLSTTNQRGDDGAADNEGKDVTVDTVPLGGQTLLSSARIGVVHEGEDQELRDKGRLDGHENSGRGSRGREHTNLVALVTLMATVACKLKTPVNSASERDDLDDVSVLK
jgi:hypothetical protein